MGADGPFDGRPSLLPLGALKRAAEIQGPPNEQFNGLTRGDVLLLVAAVEAARAVANATWFKARSEGEAAMLTDVLGLFRD